MKREMNPLEPKEARRYQLAIVELTTVLQASERVVGPALDPSVPGSAIERAKAKDLRDAYDLARLVLVSAEDHFTTILTLLKTAVLPMFALYSLLRPGATSVVRCAYLLDPSLTEQQRLARGLNVRLENLLEQHKVVRDEALLAGRVKHLEERAAKNGIAPVRAVDGKLKGFGEPRRSEIDLVRAYLPEGELLYRFLSGHVHAMAWVKFSKDKAIPSDEPGVSLMPLGLDVVTFSNALTIVLGRHDKNIAQLMRLAGYPAMAWTEAKKTAQQAAERTS